MNKQILPILLLGLVVLFSCTPKEPNISRKNIILILADDMGVPQLGCYGSNYYETLNIDKLAESGLVFNNAYSAAAVCSPTRASIMTGKYPARLHITDFIPGNNDTTKLLQEPDWQKFLPLEEITIGEVFKQHDYHTALFGKWHLSVEKEPPLSIPYNPNKQGFDEFFVTYKPSPSLPLGAWQTPENDAHNVDTLTNLAINFIERFKKDPFLLIVSHNSIHDPIMEMDSLVNKYKNKLGADLPQNNPVWAAMVETLDKSVGRIIKKVTEEDLLENTVIIFYSDNGAKHAFGAQTPFRKGKGWLYEGGIRVPLIVSWNGVTEPGTVTNEMVSSIDFFDTFLDIAGINDTLSTRDGISFYPLLKQPQTKLGRESLYWNYPHYHAGSGMKPASAIRDGDYKLIQWYEEWLSNEEGALELYNLEKDPGEQVNLASEMPEKTNELLEKLQAYKVQTNSQEPVVNQYNK